MEWHELTDNCKPESGKTCLFALDDHMPQLFVGGVSDGTYFIELENPTTLPAQAITHWAYIEYPQTA